MPAGPLFSVSWMSGGRTTHDLGKNSNIDTGMSQVFIAIDPKTFGNESFQQNLIDEIISKEHEEAESEIDGSPYGQGVDGFCRYLA